MSLFRSFLLISLISLTAALGLHLLCTAGKFVEDTFPLNNSASGFKEFRGGYAMLSTDVSVDDRTLRSLLKKGESFFGGEPVSESSQWILLDTFDSLEMIPLDKYHARVFSFDPRYDGYADKLKEIFVKDDMRFVYIPLQEGNFNVNLLDAQFDELLAGIPFSVEYFGVDIPSNHFFISYAAASFCLLIICFVTRKQNRKLSGIIALIPVFSSLAWFGAPGIACAALLFGLFVLLKEPLYDLATGSFSKGIYKEIIFPYRFYWLFLPLFAAAVYIIVIFSRLELLFLLAVFAAAAAVFLFSMKILSVSQTKRRRFNPVMILRQRFPGFVFSLFMLPFVIAAFFVLFSSPLMPAAFNSNRQFETFIYKEDYYRHLNNQVFFSTRQMGNPSAAFPAFFFAADGLPSMEIPAANQTVNVDNFPPFPLEHLMEFFNNVNSGQSMDSAGSEISGTGNISEKLSLLVLILFLLPLFFAKGKKGSSSKISLGNIKRISYKFRSKGINWNSKPLYNERNPLRMRKDA